MLDGRTIGLQLRKLRGTTSAEEVALRIGVSKSALFMYERGERIPRDDTKVLISQYYGVSVEDLFFKQVEH